MPASTEGETWDVLDQWNAAPPAATTSEPPSSSSASSALPAAQRKRSATPTNKRSGTPPRGAAAKASAGSAAKASTVAKSPSPNVKPAPTASTASGSSSEEASSTRASRGTTDVEARLRELDLAAADAKPPRRNSRGVLGLVKKQPSPAARKLLKEQQRMLAEIRRSIESAGPQNYVKHDHWAWYVWPTAKEGMSDPSATAVKGVADVEFVLANGPTLREWTAVLELLAGALRARGNRRCFPPIDHGRIDFFLKEWSSDEYRERMRSEPAFTAAVDAFGEAWKATGR